MDKLNSILTIIEKAALAAGEAVGGPIGTDIALGVTLIEIIKQLVPHAKAAGATAVASAVFPPR